MIYDDSQILAEQPAVIVEKVDESNPPNNTLYINNLNERVHIEDLKQALFDIFIKYGKIIDIKVKRNIRMRGQQILIKRQAFIIFDHQLSAEQALYEQQDGYLFGKPMKIDFAREKSEIISKRDGTYVQRDKKKLTMKFEKKVKVENKDKTQQPKIQKNVILPNNILFVENIPSNMTQEELAPFFYQYIGYREMRLIQTKNVAFIEYGDEFQSTIAMNALNGKQISQYEYTFQISYAKK